MQLIADLHKSEVFKVGAELKLPRSVLDAPPSADLWEGQTDEDEMFIYFFWFFYYIYSPTHISIFIITVYIPIYISLRYLSPLLQWLFLRLC